MRSGLQVSELCFLDWEPVSFDVQAGEIVGISGKSGSGKSLLLRSIADLDVHSGGASLGEVDCAAMPAAEWRSKVAMLPAESRWWFSTVGEHFDSECVGLIERLGFVGDVLGWEISRLSVGERQRLALARLLARAPEVLLLDEPTANLDEAATGRVESVVAESGLATLWVSHDEAQLERVAGRRYRMAGRNLEEVA